LKFHQSCEIYKKKSNFISHHIEESVRKWTGGDEKTEEQAVEEEKRNGEKIKRMGLPPNQKSWVHHCKERGE